MLESLEVQCYGGPYDGLRLSVTSSPSFVFEERQFNGRAGRRAVYALEATDEGRFRLRHLTTQDEA